MKKELTEAINKEDWTKMAVLVREIFPTKEYLEQEMLSIIPTKLRQYKVKKVIIPLAIQAIIVTVVAFILNNNFFYLSLGSFIMYTVACLLIFLGVRLLDLLTAYHSYALNLAKNVDLIVAFLWDTDSFSEEEINKLSVKAQYYEG